MNKVYTTAEIIFGTREKYLELIDKLLLLERLTSIANNKDINDISYNVHFNDDSLEERKINIGCSLIQKPKNTTHRLYQYLKYGTFNPVSLYESMLIRDDDNYALRNFLINDLISVTDQEKYNKVIEEILNMEFLNNMNFGRIRPEVIEWYDYVWLTATKIKVSSLVTDNRVGQLIYNSYGDSIKVYGAAKRFNQFRLTTDMINKLLNTPVDANKLSDYQRNLIDNSESVNKGIIIDECNDSIVNYDIHESSDSIHLVKRKIKRDI